MDLQTQIFLITLGLIAGFIDSIAGGGGLITVPVFSLLLEPGPLAIGTNKIVGMVSTGVALFVYWRGGHVKLSGNWTFALVVAFGALLGAWSSRYVPTEAYKWLIAGVAPIVLWIVFHKDMWIKESSPTNDHLPTDCRIFFFAALACGFYDGIAGPGGGTLMFLSLFVIARMPLLTSLATAKIANLASATVALATFSATGNVAWSPGLIMASGVSVGAAVGASYAIKNATVFARFALLGVSSLLIIRLLMT